MSRPRLLLFFATVLTAALASTGALAQSINGSTPNPDRGDAGVPRSAGFNPLGISYADCTADMTLAFTVSLSGFQGNANVQVWASPSSYCVARADRGVDGNAPTCWGVSQSLVDPMISGTALKTFQVRVRDLVGWQSVLPTPTQAASPPMKGQEACSAQPTSAAVPLNINFLPIDDDGNAVGTPYVYQINTDLVGPPAPSGVCETVGDTIYNLTWRPNADSDTSGYAVYIDPIPGQEPAGAGIDGGISLMPADAGGCSDPDAAPSCGDPNLLGAVIATGGGGGTDAGTDAGTDGGTDAGTEAGAAAADSGTTGDGGVAQGPSGISTIPPQYIYKATDSITLPGASTAGDTITGLVNYVPYTIVIAAVDGSGNIGPASPEVCDYPAPIQDYWQVYEADGGGKGGFCALQTLGVGGPSLAGLACAVVVAGVVRRRRRRRREG